MSGGIKLQWRDRNYAEESHRIYRSDTPMSLSSMPTPIVTLTNNVTEYIDYDVIEGNTYYYRIGAVRGADEAISDEIELIAEEPNLGPGPQELIAGDMTYGFFGETSSVDLLTYESLAEKVGISAGTSQYNNESTWLKFALDGRILYVAKKPIRHSISRSIIDNANAIYEGGPPIMVDTYSLDVTLLKGAASNPIDRSNIIEYDTYKTEGSEFNKLLYPIHSGVHTDDDNPVAHSDNTAAPFGSWGAYSDGDLLVQSSFGNGSRSWVQEVTTDNGDWIYRGQFGITSFYNFTGVNAQCGWRPCLRLIP